MHASWKRSSTGMPIRMRESRVGRIHATSRHLCSSERRHRGSCRGTIASASSISAGVGVLPVVLVDRPPGVVQVLALRPLLVVLAAAAMALRRSKVKVEP